MNASPASRPAPDFDDASAPIDVFTGDTLLDGGIATIPSALFWFARFLDADGQRLNDRQVLMMAMVLGLYRDRRMRLRNLPMRASMSTLEADMTFIRKSGLVFTRREYYPPRHGQPPRVRSQIWDVRPLLANLETLQNLWFARQAAKESEWRAAGEHGPRPVYEFPANFSHRVVVPRPVLLDIACAPRAYYPVPTRWLELVTRLFTLEDVQAHRQSRVRLPTAWNSGSAALPTAAVLGSRARPTARPGSSTWPPTAGTLGSHLLKKKEEGNGIPPPTDPVFARFAILAGTGYSPDDNDLKALRGLRQRGLSDASICAAIDEAFARQTRPRRFVYCAAIARERARRSSDTAEASLAAPAETEPAETPGIRRDGSADLSAALRLLANLPNVSLTAGESLRAMAEGCHQAAEQHNSTGTAWVLRAARLAVEAERPLAYIRATLDDWIQNGPPDRRTGARREKSRAEDSTSETGREQYL